VIDLEARIAENLIKIEANKEIERLMLLLNADAPELPELPDLQALIKAQYDRMKR